MHLLIWDRLPQAAYSKSYLEFLSGFFKAAFENNLEPMGVVHPKNKFLDQMKVKLNLE